MALKPDLGGELRHDRIYMSVYIYFGLYTMGIQKERAILEYFRCMIGNIAEAWSYCSSRSDSDMLQCYSGEIREMLAFYQFLAPKLIIGLIIRHEGLSLKITEIKFSLNPRTLVFAVLSAAISFKDIRQDFTHSICMNINSSWARSSSSC
jgi:hypothetical protein